MDRIFLSVEHEDNSRQGEISIIFVIKEETWVTPSMECSAAISRILN